MGAVEALLLDETTSQVMEGVTTHQGSDPSSIRVTTKDEGHR